MNRRHSGAGQESKSHTDKDSAPQINQTQEDNALQRAVSSGETSRDNRKSLQVVGDFCVLKNTSSKDQVGEQAARGQDQERVVRVRKLTGEDQDNVTYIFTRNCIH
jgi:hypothetical protein